MALTPIDIQNKVFRKGVRGYNTEEVDKFLKILARILRYYIRRILSCGIRFPV